MFTRFEDHAACSMLGQPDAPPRRDGRLCFAHDWQRQLYGLALAVAKEGHVEWEQFRQALIAEIGHWEQGADGNAGWDYYAHYLQALLKVVQSSGLVDADELRQCLAAAPEPAA